jgi:hypothetical protein
MNIWSDEVDRFLKDVFTGAFTKKAGPSVP